MGVEPVSTAPPTNGAATSKVEGIEAVENVPQTTNAPGHGQHKVDAAGELLRKVAGEGDRIVVSAADDKRVLRKIDTVISPPKPYPELRTDNNGI